MYEHRSQPPITRTAFIFRMLRHFVVALAFVGISLGVGMLGYLHFEPSQMTTWNDAFLNASMRECKDAEENGAAPSTTRRMFQARATTLIYKSGEFPKPIAVLPIRDPDHSCHQRRERRQNTASLPELYVSAASDV